MQSHATIESISRGKKSGRKYPLTKANIVRHLTWLSSGNKPLPDLIQKQVEGHVDTSLKVLHPGQGIYILNRPDAFGMPLFILVRENVFDAVTPHQHVIHVVHVALYSVRHVLNLGH